MYPQSEFLIERLTHARKLLKELVPRAPTNKEIYPNWTLKEYLAHMSGWDDAVTAALRAHGGGQEPGTPADRGINYYNAQTVSTREALDLEHVKKEWVASREALIKALHDLPDEKFNQPLTFPWGEFGTVAYLIEIFVEHEEHHAGHLEAWLKAPDQIIGKH